MGNDYRIHCLTLQDFDPDCSHMLNVLSKFLHSTLAEWYRNERVDFGQFIDTIRQHDNVYHLDLGRQDIDDEIGSCLAYFLETVRNLAVLTCMIPRWKCSNHTLSQIWQRLAANK